MENWLCFGVFAIFQVKAMILSEMIWDRKDTLKQ